MSEIKQVFRGLRQQPLHTVAAMVAFGLAIAANTAIFSIADALVFRPIDLPQIDRLVNIHGGPEGTKFGSIRVTPADYFDLRDRSRTLESLAAFSYSSVSLTGVGEPERLQACDVTPNFLEVMGVPRWWDKRFMPKVSGAKSCSAMTFGNAASPAPRKSSAAPCG